jgi:hypothetical protein
MSYGDNSMIISEKQIMQLYDIARMCGQILISLNHSHNKVDEISALLESIRNQQSEELREVKE